MLYVNFYCFVYFHHNRNVRSATENTRAGIDSQCLGRAFPFVRLGTLLTALEAVAGG
jgi:hypothetical protein